MASAQPSIERSVFGQVFEDLRKLVSEGGVGRAEAEAAPGGEGGISLEAPIHSSGWYNIRRYGRMELPRFRGQ